MTLSKLFAAVAVALMVLSCVVIVVPDNAQAVLPAGARDDSIQAVQSSIMTGIDPNFNTALTLNYSLSNSYATGRVQNSLTEGNYIIDRSYWYFNLTGVPGTDIKSLYLNFKVGAKSFQNPATDGLWFLIMPADFPQPLNFQCDFTDWEHSLGFLAAASVPASGWYRFQCLDSTVLDSRLGGWLCIMVEMGSVHTSTAPTDLNLVSLQAGDDQPYVEVETNVKTWDGGGADNLASTAANWMGDYLPYSGDSVVFSSVSTKACTWDLTTNLYGFTAGNGYTGVITQSSDMNIGAGGMSILSGCTFTALESKKITLAGSYVGGGTFTSYKAHFVMTGDGSVLNSVNPCAVEVKANVTFMAVLIYDQSGTKNYVKVDAGKVLTISQDRSLSLCLYYASAASGLYNNGTIAGPGEMVVTLRDVDRNLNFAGVTAKIRVREYQGINAARTITLTGHVNSLSTFTIYKTAGQLQSLTVNMNGYNITATSVNIEDMGRLRNSGSAASVNAPVTVFSGGILYYYEKTTTITGAITVNSGGQVVYGYKPVGQMFDQNMTLLDPFWMLQQGFDSLVHILVDYQDSENPEGLIVYGLIWMVILFLPGLILGYFVPFYGFQLGVIVMSIVLYVSGVFDLWIPLVGVITSGLAMWRGRY